MGWLDGVRLASYGWRLLRGSELLQLTFGAALAGHRGVAAWGTSDDDVALADDDEGGIGDGAVGVGFEAVETGRIIPAPRGRDRTTLP